MELLRTLGEFAIAAGALAWLFKALVGAFLSKDLEAHKARLQVQSQAEIEKLKSELAMVAQRQATEFATLHAKRAELIAELYGLLLSLERAVGILAIRLDYVAARALESKEVGSSGADSGSNFENVLPQLGEYEMELIRKVEDAHLNFMGCFRPSRIYLPEDLCESIVRATSSAARFSIDFEQLAVSFDRLGAEEMMKLTQSLLSLASEWQVSLDLLEGEFRILMGVRKSLPTGPAV